MFILLEVSKEKITIEVYDIWNVIKFLAIFTLPLFFYKYLIYKKNVLIINATIEY